MEREEENVFWDILYLGVTEYATYLDIVKETVAEFTVERTSDESLDICLQEALERLERQKKTQILREKKAWGMWVKDTVRCKCLIYKRLYLDDKSLKFDTSETQFNRNYNIWLRFKSGQTLQKIGQSLGLSRERIRQILIEFQDPDELGELIVFQVAQDKKDMLTLCEFEALTLPQIKCQERTEFENKLLPLLILSAQSVEIRKAMLKFLLFQISQC